MKAAASMPDSLRIVAAAPVESCLSDEDIVAFAQGGLPSGRLPEIHAHLDACETCQRLLTEAVRALATAATAPETSRDGTRWNTTFQPGVVLAKRYRIKHFIARGGMGEVYEAFDEDLQQRVALKTVAAAASDHPDAVRRLKGEVQLARRVSHPNVCRIYDFGTHAMSDGTQLSFLTMEFVEGETLGQYIRLGGALALSEARALARQMLLGLGAAHDAGVLHRDFKSDNVILRPDGAARVTPLILDFGLARALDHESQNSSNGSNPALVGTFSYLAPEQLEGKPHTRASDLYSFGVVWFEMLTGELPFDPGSSPAVAALQRLRKLAPAPSGKNPEVTSELDALVLRCLRRSPRDRFETAADVLVALDALDRSSPRLRAQRSRLWLAIGAAALFFWCWDKALTAYLQTRGRVERSSTVALTEILSSATPVASAPPSAAQDLPTQPEARRVLEPVDTSPHANAPPSASPASTAKARVHAAAPSALSGHGPSPTAPLTLASAAAPPAPPSPGSSPLAAPAAHTGGWEDPFHPRSAQAAPAEASP
jgi:serine/threonine protein kinase